MIRRAPATVDLQLAGALVPLDGAFGAVVAIGETHQPTPWQCRISAIQAKSQAPATVA
jgi:hypothetical protein